MMLKVVTNPRKIVIGKGKKKACGENLSQCSLRYNV